MYFVYLLFPWGKREDLVRLLEIGNLIKNSPWCDDSCFLGKRRGFIGDREPSQDLLRDFSSDNEACWFSGRHVSQPAALPDHTTENDNQPQSVRTIHDVSDKLIFGGVMSSLPFRACRVVAVPAWWGRVATLVCGLCRAVFERSRQGVACSPPVHTYATDRGFAFIFPLHA